MNINKQIDRFLSYRPRSEKEVWDYLKRKKASSQAIAKIIKKLKQQKLLDDAKFAAWWRDQRCQFRPRGKRGLYFELRQKGVTPAVIKEALKNVDEVKLAKKALQNKTFSYRQAGQFLARRGFSWPTIKQVLEEIFSKG